MSVYNYEDEFGKDPFCGYTNDEEIKSQLLQLLPKFINTAINRPKDPYQPHTELIALANDLSAAYSSSLCYRFYRVAGLPDPLQLEQQRQLYLEEKQEREKKEYELSLLTEEQRIELATKSHHGHWNYHDDDCQCGRYFDNSYCNRNGYIWSCCGSTSEHSTCYLSSNY